VDIVWQKSLENEDAYRNHQMKVKKYEEQLDISQNYTKAV
jgi:hypothetical protein